MGAVIRVAKDGSVASVEVEDSGLPGMVACLTKTIGGWTFPRAEAPTDTRLPIIFRPEVKQELPEAAMDAIQDIVKTK